MKEEYVVALEKNSDKLVKVWKGGFRAYDERKIFQYKVVGETKEDAIGRALTMHASRKCYWK